MTVVAHLLLSWPLYVVVLLACATIAAYRASDGSLFHSARRLYAIATVLVYAGSVPAVSNRITLALEQQYGVPAVSAPAAGSQDVIVVLTGGWFHRQAQGYGPKIGNDGWERLDAAIRLRQQTGGRLLITGAPSPDGSTSIARVMGEVAERNGVPRVAIELEEAATNTYENLLFSKQLLKTESGRIWLVTSAHHMPRAMAVARKLGLPLVAFPCDFRGEVRVSWRAFVPAAHAPLALEKSLHEIIGLLVYRWRGWA
jgi:uncharacterized SAM-binding protein YcdF (DUF218 family)